MMQKLARFMYGRNGADQFSRFTSYLALIFLVISMFLGGVLNSVGFLVALALLVYTYFRVFSKNLAPRRRENEKYLRYKNRFTDWLKLRREIWKQRKEFKFFRCSSCKAMLRVPRGKGKIRVLCKKCGTAFEKKT